MPKIRAKTTKIKNKVAGDLKNKSKYRTKRAKKSQMEANNLADDNDAKAPEERQHHEGKTGCEHVDSDLN